MINRNQAKHFRYVIPLIVLLISICYGLGVEASNTMLEKSVSLIQTEQKYDQAIKLLKKEVTKNPQNALAHYWIGIAYYKTQNYKYSAKSLHTAVNLNLPESFKLSTYLFMGWAYYRSWQSKPAIDAFEKGLAINPDHPGILEGLGMVHTFLLKNEKAIQFFSRYLEQFPNEIRILIDRGWAYHQEKNYDQAIHDFNKTISLSPNTRDLHQCYRGRGWSRYYLGEFEEALKDFDSAIALNYQSSNKSVLSDPYKGKAFCLLGLGNYNDALEYREKKKEIFKSDFEDNWHDACVYLLQGRSEKVIELFRTEVNVGISFKANDETDLVGAHVFGIRPEGTASTSGLQMHDRITLADGEAIQNQNDLIKKIHRKSPGDIMELVVDRNGENKQIQLKIGSLVEAVKKQAILEPILKNRKTGNISVQREAVKNNRVETNGNQVAAPAPESVPNLVINGIEIEPSVIEPKKIFRVKIDIYLEDLANKKDELETILHYTILQNKKVLKKFKPESFRVKNGISSMIIKKTKASKKKGKYQIRIEMVYQSLKEIKYATFKIE